MFGRKAVVLVMAFLLCAGILVACGKDQNGTKDGAKATASPTVTGAAATSTPTASPTPTVPFAKRTYETVGRDDIFRVPVKELEEDWYLVGVKCAGDYALLWLTPPESGEEFAESNNFVLLKPCENDTREKLSVEYQINEPILLADGTVILEERDTYRIHVFDDKLTEVSSFLPRGEASSWLLGVSDSCVFWHEDKASSKLLATDRQGQPAGELAIDPKYGVTRYVGTEGGRKLFLTITGDYSEFGYLVVPEDGSEVSYLAENESELGDWAKSDVAAVHTPDIVEADSTWFFHTPGFLREGVAFPKFDSRETQSFLQGKTLCSCVYRPVSEVSEERVYRVYDMEKRTVSEMLPESLIPDCSYLAPRGIVGDGYVMMSSSLEEGGVELLLGDAGEKMAPIEGFCDFSKDDIRECLSGRLQDLKESCGIEITPDKTEDDGTVAALGELMAELDFVNMIAFAAQEHPEVLKAKDGGSIHPENIRNNDGANYTFNPHVFSTIMLQQHGEKRKDNFFRFVDALRAGADTFECTDRDSADWCCSMAYCFYPVGGVYASASYAGNGVAEIVYKIPKEEFLAKAKDFEERICTILNDALEDDYTDLEKALSIYEFLTEYCVYDYEMLEHSLEWMDRQSAYRVLIEKRGICGEIASLYRYLLLQCGVDVEETSGAPTDGTSDLHAWNYVVLDGKGYLIDATWGLTNNRKPDLAYFLFTDERRENRDGYKTSSCTIGICPLYEARGKYSFEAKDERFSALWEGTYVAFDEDGKCIFYRDQNGTLKRFDYGE